MTHPEPPWLREKLTEGAFRERLRCVTNGCNVLPFGMFSNAVFPALYQPFSNPKRRRWARTATEAIEEPDQPGRQGLARPLRQLCPRAQPAFARCFAVCLGGCIRTNAITTSMTNALAPSSPASPQSVAIKA